MKRWMGSAVVAWLAWGSVLSATITGTVIFDGKPPKPKPIDMRGDAACMKMHAQPQPSEDLVLGPGKTLANVLVSVTAGLPAGASWPAPEAPVVLDQNGCRYEPHVAGAMVGQPFKVLNSDGILHNVHSYSTVNTPFNVAMPPAKKEINKSFGRAEGMFKIRCDVHAWMYAYVGVFPHPFFSVTQADGTFSIAGLEPGTYELSAWHETLGVRKAIVTVKDAGAQSVSFSFGAPAAN